jgi:FAD/FMN-containing dehydrogenase
MLDEKLTMKVRTIGAVRAAAREKQKEPEGFRQKFERRQREAGLDPNDFTAWLASPELAESRASVRKFCERYAKPVEPAAAGSKPVATVKPDATVAALPTRTRIVMKDGLPVVEQVADVAAMAAQTIGKMKTRGGVAGETTK